MLKHILFTILIVNFLYILMAALALYASQSFKSIQKAVKDDKSSLP